MRRGIVALSSKAYPLGSRTQPSILWPKDKPPTYPSSRTQHPNKYVARRLRKSRLEWERHHGSGQNVNAQGLMREVNEWSYADGTPGTVSKSEYHFRYYKNKLLYQIIRSAAEVEKRIAEGRIPKIPGTKETRDWDPQVPLFLEDVDEAGVGPQAAANLQPAIDLDAINDIKMKPKPFLYDRRKQYLTKEYLVPRVPTIPNMMKEEWKPSNSTA
eukprot:PhF_6_TR27032/c0_g1_i2/m.39482